MDSRRLCKSLSHIRSNCGKCNIQGGPKADQPSKQEVFDSNNLSLLRGLEHLRIANVSEEETNMGNETLREIRQRTAMYH
jgi:hypothetical protein